VEDVLGTIVGALVVGIIVGPLARLALPGKQNISLGMTILLGFVGALVGGLVYEALGGTDTPGIDWIRLLIQVGVAAVAVVIYLNMQGRRAT
jgi:uncharacterized membrane protein YeaQ/YmgE (transglycosylase-associated protein family)